MSTHKRAMVPVLISLLAVIILSGCSVNTDRSPRVSPDWSRGLRLGYGYLNQPVAMAVDETQTVHLVWCAWGEDGTSRLHYVALDRQARVSTEQDLDIPVSHPRRPQLLFDDAGELHLVWIARSEEGDSIFHAVIGPDGEVAAGPQRLAPSDQEVDRFQLYGDATGHASVVWANISEVKPGIYQLSLDESDGPLEQATLIIPDGHTPSAQVDSTGTLHLIWLKEVTFDQEDLYYAAFPHSQVTPTPGVKLARLVVGQSVILAGPKLGLDDTTVYVFWSLERRGGGLQGAGAEAWYLSFPLGRPAESKRQQIKLPTTSQPSYAAHQGPYNYTSLHYLDSQETIYGSDFVYMPAVVPGQREELPVMLMVKISTRTKARPQPVMAVFADGVLTGYQLVALTDSASTQPNVVADNDANLHATWTDLGGAWEFQVYYATTAPTAAAWLNRTSTADVLNRAFDLIWGVLSGISLIPVTGVWIMPALIWTVIYYVLTGEDDLSFWKAKIGLGTAVLVYLAAKLILLPSFLLYVPGLDQVPEQFASLLVLGVPLLIMGIALGAVYVYQRRAEHATLFPAFFVLVLTDVVLTLIVYSPSIFRQ